MTEETKVVVRPNTENYATGRAASGAKTQHNGDPVATALNGATLEEVFGLAAEAIESTPTELAEKYGHLNPGMQRMNLGNRIRGVVNKMNKEKEGSGDKWVADLASGVQEAVAKREQERAAAAKAKEEERAKAAKEKETEAKAKAKPKAKAKSKAA